VIAGFLFWRMSHGGASAAEETHMKAGKAGSILARFGPETRFEVKPGAARLARKEEEDKLEGLKRELLDKALTEAWEPQVRRFLATSANEAAALAWVTGYPLLVFPGLFEEKAASALHQFERQLEITQRSRELLAV